eukprot:2584204-Rhodomonas_salina.1
MGRGSKREREREQKRERKRERAREEQGGASDLDLARERLGLILLRHRPRGPPLQVAGRARATASGGSFVTLLREHVRLLLHLGRMLLLLLGHVCSGTVCTRVHRVVTGRGWVCSVKR